MRHHSASSSLHLVPRVEYSNLLCKRQINVEIMSKEHRLGEASKTVPSRNREDYWLFCDEGAEPMSFQPDECGKWMLFYPSERIDQSWEAAKSALRASLLQGVVEMKVSTARAAAENAQAQQQQGRGSYTPSHVLIFYCGPATNKELVMSIGRRVARAMNPSVKSM